MGVYYIIEVILWKNVVNVKAMSKQPLEAMKRKEILKKILGEEMEQQLITQAVKEYQDEVDNIDDLDNGILNNL